MHRLRARKCKSYRTTRDVITDTAAGQPRLGGQASISGGKLIDLRNRSVSVRCLIFSCQHQQIMYQNTHHKTEGKTYKTLGDWSCWPTITRGTTYSKIANVLYHIQKNAFSIIWSLPNANRWHKRYTIHHSHTFTFLRSSWEQLPKNLCSDIRLSGPHQWLRDYSTELAGMSKRGFLLPDNTGIYCHMRN